MFFIFRHQNKIGSRLLPRRLAWSRQDTGGNPFTFEELVHFECFGFCDPGKAAEATLEGTFSREGALPCNPSGGVLCTNPIGATALIRVAEAALQVTGNAEIDKSLVWAFFCQTLFIIKIECMNEQIRGDVVDFCLMSNSNFDICCSITFCVEFPL